MDDPALDPALHRAALAGLRRINRWSFAGHHIWHSIRKLVERHALREIRVLDLACGSGDVALDMKRRSIACGIPSVITGCDISPVAVAEAQRQAARAGLSKASQQIEFVQLDVLHDPLPADYDIVMCSLFLHHLDEQQAEYLLRRMSEATRYLVLVDDLRRTRSGYWLAWWATRLLSRSPIVHYDGPVSVAGAFTVQEIAEIASRAGLNGARVRPHWPVRFLLEWSRLQCHEGESHRRPADDSDYRNDHTR